MITEQKDQQTKFNKYSLGWWFVNGMHFKHSGYGIERLARSLLSHMAFRVGYAIAKAESR
jgi:hypothetical protein